MNGEQPHKAVEHERHPKGLYVLFFTEMWERFGFYSMLAMFVLYLRDDRQGFGWSAADATRLYANYLMFVYASPLLGGILADRIKALGYRNSVLIGGAVFMVGYFLLAIHSVTAVYVALLCLVVGNGFFKPNVSAMVGHLYPEGSKLKDRAYNIFYMGINIGALLAPINAEIWVKQIGFNGAFAIAGFGMILSVVILWTFKQYVEAPGTQPASVPVGQTQAIAVSADVPPAPSLRPIDQVSDARRVGALIVIFLIVIVFWMVFHQNGSTVTFWADDNTAWNVSGIISNAINPFWVVVLTFPVVWMWHWLAKKNLEPSIPAKMAIGMGLTAVSFGILALAARTGETQTVTDQMLAVGDFRVTDRALDQMKEEGVPAGALEELKAVKGKKFGTDRTYEDAWATIEGELAADLKQAKADLTRHREEDKSLQARIRQAKAEGRPAGGLEKELAHLRAGKTALQAQAKRAEKDVEALKDAKIKEGTLPPAADRGEGGNKEFVEAVEEVIKGNKGLSPAGAARVRRLAKGTFTGKEKLESALARPSVLGPEDAEKYALTIEKHSYLFKMSPLWLILAVAVVTLGELMLSPMGLSLVSKVAPVRLRGMMMGGWFVATAIGNKLTMIGVYWEIWRQSTFFVVLAVMALVMGLVLLVLLRPLQKSMPGV